MNKNEEIAKMIGWKNKRHSLGYYYWEKPDGEKLPAFKPLMFDTDSNWQDEAIDFIEKVEKSNYRVEILGNLVLIYNDLDNIQLISVAKLNKKRAKFEALFQFSQHLKNKL